SSHRPTWNGTSWTSSRPALAAARSRRPNEPSWVRWRIVFPCWAEEGEVGVGEARAFGRYFEDFEVGDVYKHWPGKTITEADDHLFCMITMNHHPLHTNAHYAETSTQFKRNVVVGNLVYSLALGMSVPDVSG